MTAATVLPLILLIAALFAAAIVVGNAVLDDVIDRARADREMRESIEAERRKAAALRPCAPAASASSGYDGTGCL